MLRTLGIIGLFAIIIAVFGWIIWERMTGHSAYGGLEKPKDRQT